MYTLVTMSGDSIDRPGERPRPAADPEVGNGPGTELGLLKDLVGFNLRRAYNRAAQLFSRTFEDLDLAPMQFAALEFISRNPGSCQKDIALNIGTTPPVLVAPLERLEKRGLISRSRAAADRRRFGIALTPTGREVMGEVEQRILAVDHDLVAALTETERKLLLELLQRVSATT